MQILASRFIYPEEQENLVDILSAFRDTAIQLSFFKHQDFFKMEHNLIKEICDSLNISVLTVHAPTVDVFDSDFLKVIEQIKQVYKTTLITIHPQKGDRNLALVKLEQFASLLEESGVILAYENFPSSASKRKWICTPRQMHSSFNLPFLNLTFDTSHLDSPENCIEEFKAVADKVAVVHLSDVVCNMQHQPLGRGSVPYQEFLSYLHSIGFKGPVVIEYMQEYDEQLVEDTKKIATLFGCSNNHP